MGILAQNAVTPGFYTIESNGLTALSVNNDHVIVEKPAPLFCFELTADRRQFVTNSFDTFFAINRLQSRLTFSLRNVETDALFEVAGTGCVFFNIQI